MNKLLISFFIFWSLNVYAKTTTLALNWKAEPEFGGFYSALLQNLYQHHKINLSILEGGSGTPTVQMLANGKVDFAIVSADELILSNERNPQNQIKALFAVYQKSPYMIMTHAEKKYSSLKDVLNSEGVVSLQTGLPFYQYLIKKFGKPKARIVPFLGGIGNFLADANFSQQGFITSEPLMASKKGVKVQNFLVADEGFNPYLVVLATKTETITKEPELIKNFIQATRAGWQEYIKNPSRANEYMAKLNPSMDLETFKESAEAQKPFIATNQLGAMTEERWAQLIQQLTELKIIQTPLKAKEMFLTSK